MMVTVGLLLREHTNGFMEFCEVERWCRTVVGKQEKSFVLGNEIGWVLPCWCWIIIFTFLYDDFFIFYFLVVRKGKETGAFGFSW